MIKCNVFEVGQQTSQSDRFESLQLFNLFLVKGTMQTAAGHRGGEVS